MKLINYKDKYIKYKNKYLEIKNIIQKGGIDCNNDRVFKNILGTCWMVDILMMICFGDATKNDIESMLIIIKDDIKKLIESKICELESFFPPAYLQIPNREEFLINLLQAFIKRYFAKLGVHTTVPVIAINPTENTLRCERIMNFNFKHLFSYYKSPDVEGGDIIQEFYFANILGILLLNQNIYFTNYTRKNYKNIIFNPTQDIGIIVKIEKHVCCFFICKGEYKFYNDHDKKIYNCQWNNLLSKLLDNEDLFVVNGKVLNLDRTEFFENIEIYSSYKRIKFLTVVSRRDIQGSLNKQIPIYFDDDNKDKIHDFTILHCIGLKYFDNKNYDKYIEFSKISADLGYGSAQIEIGNIFEQGIITDKNIDLAYCYYELAVENGENYAALKLGNFYKEKDYKKAIKYLLIAVNSFITEIKDKAAQTLYDIYYNKYKNYKEAIKYKSIFNKEEADTNLEELKEFEKLKELSDEGFFDLQFDIGLKYIKKEDKANAILYLNLAYKSKQINLSTDAAYLLGKIYHIEKDIKKTIEYYLHAYQSDNKNISSKILLELGQIYFNEGDLDKAIYYLKETIKKNIPIKTGPAALKLSEIFLNQGDKNEAIFYLKLAVEKASAAISGEAAFKLYELLIKKDENEAISYLKLAANKNSTEALIKLYEILIKRDEDEIDIENISYLKLIAEKGLTDISAKVAIKLGEFYYKNKTYIDAVKYLKIALNSDETKIASALLLSEIYLQHYKNYRLGFNYKLIVEPENKKHIEKLENFDNLKKLADKGFFDLQYDVGIKYLDEGKELEAIEYLNKAMNTNQNDLLAKVALKLGEILINQNKEDEAICYLNLATIEGKKNIQIRAFFKLAEINEKKNIDEAIAIYEKIIDLSYVNKKFNDVFEKTVLKFAKNYFDKNDLLNAKDWLVEGIKNGPNIMLVEYVSLLLEIFKKEEKKIKDVSEYLIRFIDNSKICLVLHELDKIL